MTVRKAQPRELVARDHLCFAAWGGRLTQAQFFKREERLRAHPWSRQGMTTWLLEDERGELLSSCESFQMESRYDNTTGHSYAFASVFTEERFRGRGYATALLKGVIEALENSDASTQSFILYSEVGERLYEKNGFVAVPSQMWELPESLFARKSPQVEYVSDEEIQGLLDVAHARTERFQILATAAQLDWHWERERIYAEALGRPKALCHASRVGESFAIWSANYKYDFLEALVFQSATESQRDILLTDGAELCRRLGLTRLQIWDTPASGLAGLKMPPLPRRDSIAMIRPAGPLRAGFDHSFWSEVPRALWV